MDISYSPSLLRVFKKLDPHIKDEVKETIGKIIDAYTLGAKTPGLGLKHLRGPIWEARAGIKIRVLYSLSGEKLRFVLAGSHDDVKNYLKGI